MRIHGCSTTGCRASASTISRAFVEQARVERSPASSTSLKAPLLAASSRLSGKFRIKCSQDSLAFDVGPAVVESSISVPTSLVVAMVMVQECLHVGSGLALDCACW